MDTHNPDPVNTLDGQIAFVDHRVAVIPAVLEADARYVIVAEPFGEPATLCFHVLFALLRRVRLFRPEQDDPIKGDRFGLRLP